MKNTIYDIVKNAARYSFAVLFILGVLQPFEIDKADVNLAFRGSSNQNIISINEQ